MKSNTLRTAFIAFVLITLYSCGKINKEGKNKKEALIDSLILQARDSVVSNFTFACNNIRQVVQLAEDSMEHYRLLEEYSRLYFISTRYDTIPKINRYILAFCNRQQSSPELHTLMGIAYNEMGNYFGQINQVDSMQLNYEKAFQHIQKSNKLEKLPDVCINLADGYIQKGDYIQGISYYRKALLLSDSLSLTKQLSFPIYCGLGRIYMELRDFNLSDHYYRLAEEQVKDRSLHEKFSFYNNRGNYYYYKEEYAQALPWFHKARTLVYPQKELDFYISFCELNMGEIYQLINKPDSARFYLDRSFRFFSTINHPSALHYINTQRIALALLENKFAEVKKLLKDPDKSIGVDPNMVMIRNKYLQKYYEKTGNYQKAFHYQTLNIRMNDSTRAYRVQKRVEEIDMRYKQDTTIIKRGLVIQKQLNEMKQLKTNTFI